MGEAGVPQLARSLTVCVVGEQGLPPGACSLGRAKAPFSSHSASGSPLSATGLGSRLWAARVDGAFRQLKRRAPLRPFPIALRLVAPGITSVQSGGPRTRVTPGSKTQPRALGFLSAPGCAFYLFKIYFY